VTQPRGPLFVLHTVLISAAIGLGVLLLVWGLVMHRSSGATNDLLLGVSGGVAALLGGLYLRWFRSK
jgi:hypothetical protein